MPIPPQSKRTRVKHSRGFSLRQGIRLQDLALQTAESMAEDVKTATEDKEVRARLATALANVNRSWCAVLDRIQDLKGIGKPKPREAKPAGRHRPAPHSPPVFDPQDEPAPSPLPTAHSADKSAAA